MPPSKCRTSCGNPRSALRRPAAAALLALTLPTALLAQESPSLDQDLKGAPTIMKEKSRASAAVAILAGFECQPGSPGVVRQVTEIDADLKFCRFRAAVPPARALLPIGGATEPAATLLPGDAPHPLPAPLAEAMDAWSRGERTRFLSLSSKLQGLPPRTASYVHALRDIALGRLARAREALDRILVAEPSCAGALLHRGILRLDLRESEGAAADLNAARSAAASVPALYDALASLAVLKGNMEAAQAHLQEALSAGAPSPGIERLSGWIRRSAEGPPWPRRFEVATRTAAVASDESEELCREVAGLLEESFAVFLKEFPGTTSPEAPLQVLVFRVRGDYLRHGEALGWEPGSPHDGAYIPGVRTMLLLPQAPPFEVLFRARVRREAFHAFLDGNRKGCPPWFDEGFARWFELAGEKDEVPGPEPIHPLAAKAIRERAGSLPTPLRHLLLMDPATFQKKRHEYVADSSAFVQYLRKTRNPPGRPLLTDYLLSLRSGLSGEEAFRKHFEPHLPVLERGFIAWATEKVPK